MLICTKEILALQQAISYYYIVLQVSRLFISSISFEFHKRKLGMITPTSHIKMIRKVNDFFHCFSKLVNGRNEN